MRPTCDQHATNNIKEYKEYKEIKNNIPSSARVREEDFIEVLEEGENEEKKEKKESYLERLQNDEAWQNAIARRFAFPNPGLVKDKLSEFDLDMVCRGKTAHQSIQDYMGHFCDWLLKNSKYENKYGIYKQEKPNGSKFVPRSSEGEIYSGSF